MRAARRAGGRRHCHGAIAGEFNRVPDQVEQTLSQTGRIPEYAIGAGFGCEGEGVAARERQRTNDVIDFRENLTCCDRRLHNPLCTCI